MPGGELLCDGQKQIRHNLPDQRGDSTVDSEVLRDGQKRVRYNLAFNRLGMLKGVSQRSAE